MNEPSLEIFDMLILSGAVELAGIDSSNGEFLYSITKEMANVLPELYEKHLQDVNNKIMSLWQEGFLEVQLLDNSPMVTLTDKAFDPKELSRISVSSLEYLNEIKRLLQE